MNHFADLSPERAKGYSPPGGKVLVGPFLTEGQFARQLGLKPAQIRRQPWLLRISATLGVQPAYPAFQLDKDELRVDVAFVALLLKRRVSDLEACDWLVRPHESLGRHSPNRWLEGGGSLRSVVDILPEPTRHIPDTAPRADLSEIRRAWLDFRSKDATPGWTIAWERIARRAREAHPIGV